MISWIHHSLKWRNLGHPPINKCTNTVAKILAQILWTKNTDLDESFFFSVTGIPKRNSHIFCVYEFIIVDWRSLRHDRRRSILQCERHTMLLVNFCTSSIMFEIIMYPEGQTTRFLPVFHFYKLTTSTASRPEVKGSIKNTFECTFQKGVKLLSTVATSK